MSSSLSPLSFDSVALQQPVVDAAVMDQLSQTVQQLVLAALAHARQMEAHPMQAGPGVLAGNAATPLMQAMPAMAARQPWSSAQRATAALPLTGREREVLHLIATGDSNKMIARALGLSLHTVKRHVANILGKLDLRSRGQAAAWWMCHQSRQTGH